MRKRLEHVVNGVVQHCCCDSAVCFCCGLRNFDTHCARPTRHSCDYAQDRLGVWQVLGLRQRRVPLIGPVIIGEPSVLSLHLAIAVIVAKFGKGLTQCLVLGIELQLDEMGSALPRVTLR